MLAGRKRSLTACTTAPTHLFCVILGTEKKFSSTTLVLINFANSNKSILQLPASDWETLKLSLITVLIEQYFSHYLLTIRSDNFSPSLSWTATSTQLKVCGVCNNITSNKLNFFNISHLRLNISRWQLKMIWEEEGDYLSWNIPLIISTRKPSQGSHTVIVSHLIKQFMKLELAQFCHQYCFQPFDLTFIFSSQEIFFGCLP